MLSRNDALKLLIENPVYVAHQCGFDKLRDYPHADWIREAIFAKEDFHITAHRNSFKTTAIDMVGSALRLILYPNQNGIIFRKTDDKVLEVVRGIKKCLSAPIMQVLFNAIWQTNKGFTFRGDMHSLSLSHYCRAGGAMQLSTYGFQKPVTGAHADWIFTDDISDLEDSTSVAAREWTKLNFLDLKNIITADGIMGHSNTPWHAEDVRILMPKAKEYDCYSTKLMTPEQIEAKRREFASNPKMFACNYELKFIADEDAPFGQIMKGNVADFPLDGCHAYIDPAFSATGHDYTSMCLLSGGDEPRPLRIMGFAWRMAWNKLINAVGDITDPDINDSILARIIREYNIKQIAIECNALDDNPIYVLQRFGVPIKKVIHTSSQGSKHKRIEAALPWVGKMILCDCGDDLANRVFNSQIRDYNIDAEYRDSADSLSGILEADGIIRFDK